MTDQDKIKALAELEGNWIVRNIGEGMVHWKDYFTYDAIIPLILKHPHITRRKVFDAMEELLDEADFGSPTQLADALLVATGKMKGQK